jgi:hypothetical protein
LYIFSVRRRISSSLEVMRFSAANTTPEAGENTSKRRTGHKHEEGGCTFFGEQAHSTAGLRDGLHGVFDLVQAAYEPIAPSNRTQSAPELSSFEGRKAS